MYPTLAEYSPGATAYDRVVLDLASHSVFQF